MAPKPREQKPVRSARDLFSKELRRRREGAGLSLDSLADIVNYSKSHIHGVETGDRIPLPPLPEKLDAALGAAQFFADTWEVVKREQIPKRFDHCLPFEAKATRLHIYAASLVPGMLQTAPYMRSLFELTQPDASEEKINGLVAKRLSRQERLRGDAPPYFWAILDEAVLRRTVGGPAVMVEQLRALLTFVNTARSTIQVVPFTQFGYPIMNGTVMLLTQPDNSTVLYEEGDGVGEMIEDHSAIERRICDYDRMQAYALSPEASARYIAAALEDHKQCEPHPS